MRTAILLVSALLSALPPSWAQSPDPHVGAWKLETRDAPPAAPVEIRIAAAGAANNYEFALTTRNADGQLATEKYVRAFDGKPRPAPNDAATTRVFERVEARTLRMASRRNDGQRSSTHTYTVSQDGKTLTDRYERRDPDGSKFENTASYARQP
jgi:hypothetical protein